MKNNNLIIAFLISISLSCAKQDNIVETGAIHFIVISDWGINGASNQLKVAKEMELVDIKNRPEFILTCGDNFQYSGVKSAQDPLWQINYENVYDVYNLKIPWYPALGNHDYYGNPQAEVDYSKIDTFWRMPSRYYTFTRILSSTLKVRFIIIDTPDLVYKISKTKDTSQINNIEQIIWLKGLLAESKNDWIFVFGHFPVFSSGVAHGDTKELVSFLYPILNYYKVDFYICGHDHDFEHARIPGKTTEYFVTGTGAWVNPIKGNSRTVFCLSSLGFTNITVSNRKASIQFITAAGDTAYSYTKMK